MKVKPGIKRIWNHKIVSFEKNVLKPVVHFKSCWFIRNLTKEMLTGKSFTETLRHTAAWIEIIRILKYDVKNCFVRAYKLIESGNNI